MNLQEMIKIAVSVQEVHGAATVELSDGSRLFCQIRFTNSNSRGKRVGSRHSPQFFHKPVTAKYSHRVSKAAAVALLNGEG